MQAAGVMMVAGPVEPLELPGPPPPRPDEVLIEIKAAGVGNWDRFVQEGSWDVGIAAPMALGVEAAGVLVEVGADARFEPGDEVMTFCVPLRQPGKWERAGARGRRPGYPHARPGAAERGGRRPRPGADRRSGAERGRATRGGMAPRNGRRGSHRRTDRAARSHEVRSSDRHRR